MALDAQLAIIGGFRGTARVVTAAAIIMTSFIFGGDAVVNQSDWGSPSAYSPTLPRRMTFVPAVRALLGDHAWRLPRTPERLLRKLDIEGESLKTHRPTWH